MQFTSRNLQHLILDLLDTDYNIEKLLLRLDIFLKSLDLLILNLLHNNLGQMPPCPRSLNKAHISIICSEHSIEEISLDILCFNEGMQWGLLSYSLNFLHYSDNVSFRY